MEISVLTLSFEQIALLVSLMGQTPPCPSEFLIDSNGIPTKEPNPRFFAWIQQDHNVLRWINATLSEGVVAHVVGLSIVSMLRDFRFL